MSTNTDPNSEEHTDNIAKCNTQDMTGDQSIDVLFQPLSAKKQDSELYIFKDKQSAIDASQIIYKHQDCEKLSLQTFVLYPNPSSGRFNISIESNKDPLIIQVTNIQGTEVYKKALDNFSGMYDGTIDISNNPQGTYIVYIIQNQHVHTDHVIVTK